MERLNHLSPTQKNVLAFIAWCVEILIGLSLPHYFPVVAFLASLFLLIFISVNGRVSPLRK